jgi:DNA protecting protein DprA
VSNQLALLGLWSVCGFGAKRLQALQTALALDDIARLPCKDWLPLAALPTHLHRSFPPNTTLQLMGEQTLEKAKASHMKLVFPDEAGFPPGLEILDDMPPLLFAWGEVSPVDSPKVAMVGPRKVEASFVPVARHFADQAAKAGALVVSGAAEGVDQACLQAGMAVGGRAWAFVGCGLDCLAVAQQVFWKRHMREGGTYFSEYPPGVQANRFTFPRRNRLISAAADAVVVMRAPRKSGSLHTAAAAVEQRRPLWVFPGEPEGPNTEGCLQLLKKRWARLATGPEEVLASLGGGAPPPEGPSRKEVQGFLFPNATPRAKPKSAPAPLSPMEYTASLSPTEYTVETRVECPVVPPMDSVEPPVEYPVEPEALSPEACLVLEQLKAPTLFEDLLASARMDSAGLSAVLCELELLGKVVQRPGKRYERV